MKKLLMMIGAAAIAVGTNASSITIDSVVQRWPWNNKVDVTYTVSGGQNRARGVYCGLRFDITTNGQTYGIEGYSIGASAEDGKHSVTFTAPSGIRAADCMMTATLFTTNTPSGNDYMIVDLDTGSVWYEGLWVDQDGSDTHYNTTEYKSSKLILRRVPRWADRSGLPNAASLPSDGYPVGYGTTYGNYAKNWKTNHDYYIGVFPVTQVQYVKLGLTNPSGKNKSDTAIKPVEQVSWNDLRIEGTSPTNSIPLVNSKTGTFLQRLNYVTGNRFGFDLPTEIMWEIASRAGATTLYYWGADDATDILDYVICKENYNTTADVGTLRPNNWGLFDTFGNVSEWCLDTNGALSNLKDADNPFKAAVNDAKPNRIRRSADWSTTKSNDGFKASSRLSEAPTRRGSWIGFRVSCIVK